MLRGLFDHAIDNNTEQAQEVPIGHFTYYFSGPDRAIGLVCVCVQTIYFKRSGL